MFLPTGSAAFDFWGGNRLGANVYANCLLVLDAATGKHVWHYQFVHHDLWDRDLPSAPVLVTVTHNGTPVDAVAQTTKSGYVFLFNRETGEPLLPITERPVPPSDLKGEQAWPTQPLPEKPAPFARQAFTEAEVTDLSQASHDSVLAKLRTTRTGRQFIPPSAEGHPAQFRRHDRPRWPAPRRSRCLEPFPCPAPTARTAARYPQSFTSRRPECESIMNVTWTNANMRSTAGSPAGDLGRGPDYHGDQ